MKITITFDNGQAIDIPVKEEVVNEINAKYPEMGMMVAMEELDELGIALSKGVRNGSEDKLDNIAEEMTDVCTVIMWAINRFGITPKMIQKWTDYKVERNDDRMKDDSLVFRSDEAKKAYDDHQHFKKLSKMTSTLDHKPEKVSKKASKDLDKVLDKASKKAKDVDKKKDNKKKKDDKKKDDKKGKKDKK